MLENIGHVRAVRRAKPSPRRIGRIFGVLIEIIIEDSRFSGLGREPRPDPGLPAESRVASEVAGSLRNRPGTGWISCDQLVGKRAVTRLHGRDIVLRSLGRPEARTLIRVVADQDGRVIVKL